jgi:hypothetical protein
MADLAGFDLRPVPVALLPYGLLGSKPLAEVHRVNVWSAGGPACTGVLALMCKVEGFSLAMQHEPLEAWLALHSGPLQAGWGGDACRACCLQAQHKHAACVNIRTDLVAPVGRRRPRFSGTYTNDCCQGAYDIAGMGAG